MFFWIDGPAGFDAAATLPLAAERGVAYVPGSAFYVCEQARQPAVRRQMRLSFVTLSVDQIEEAVMRLGAHLRMAVNLAG
jgi:2-aminoadipate transaminase